MTCQGTTLSRVFILNGEPMQDVAPSYGWDKAVVAPVDTVPQPIVLHPSFPDFPVFPLFRTRHKLGNLGRFLEYRQLFPAFIINKFYPSFIGFIVIARTWC